MASFTPHTNPRTSLLYSKNSKGFSVDLVIDRFGPRFKEVCNGGVACSLLKLGSLEKNIIVPLCPLVCTQAPLFWGKTGYAIF